MQVDPVQDRQLAPQLFVHNPLIGTVFPMQVMHCPGPEQELQFASHFLQEAVAKSE